MGNYKIIDSHVHTGVQNVRWGWETVQPQLQTAGISGAGVIAPVEDVYDRHNPDFLDHPTWQACRRRAHRYLLDLKGAPEEQIDTFPYFFVWNDFAWEDLGPEYVAIKWHRHPDEPAYRYGDPRCREFLEVVRTRGLPILLEESFENTLFFLEKLAPDQTIIIPHLGNLNGGYANLARARVWDLPRVFADSSTADPAEIEDFLGRRGPAALVFASDYPFGVPRLELDKILALRLPEEKARLILGDNFRRLCGLNKHE